MNKARILITDNVHPVLIKGLTELGFSVDYNPSISLNETIKILYKYIGVVVNTKTIMNKKAIDMAKNLKLIARLGSGLDMIDIDYATKKNIHVVRSPEGNCNAVAEHALGMLLSLTNNLVFANKQIREGKWNREQNRGIELRNRTIGLIGYGHTGQQFAKVLSGLGMTIQYYDPYRQILKSDDPNIKRKDLMDLKTTSDILSFHVPLTSETKFMCDSKFLNSCKNNVIIINTSRGKVVKLDDLVAALKHRKVMGACLDVFENEKPKSFTECEKITFSELCLLENVILSPHIAGWTVESKKKIADVLLQKIKELSINL